LDVVSAVGLSRLGQRPIVASGAGRGVQSSEREERGGRQKKEKRVREASEFERESSREREREGSAESFPIFPDAGRHLSRPVFFD
jgi:hypothetical protein